jgi:uncharacterized membrane protein
MTTSMSKTPPTNDLRSLIEQEELRATDPFRRRLQWAALFGPAGLTLALLTVAAVFGGLELVWQLVASMFFIFTVLGKFAVFLGASGGVPFDPWQIAGIVSYMDISIAVVLVYNLPRLYRLPGIGPRLEDLAEHGRYMLERNPALGRMTFAGVVAFVMFPLTGTGAIGGSIFGRLLGLGSKRTLAAIATGALAGSFGMAYFADTMAGIFTAEVRASWQFRAAGFVVVALLVALVTWRSRKVAQELRERRAARASEAAAATATAAPERDSS